MTIMSGKDIIISLLYVDGKSKNIGEPVKSITRMEKLIFILSRESKDKKLRDIINTTYSFKPYHYGPFSDKLQDHLEALRDMGIISIKEKDLPFRWDELADEYFSAGQDEILEEKTIQIYSLTNLGMKIASKILEDEKPLVVAEIKNIKKKFASEPLVDILRYVYSKYKDMTTKSRIREKYSTKISLG